MLLEDPVVLLGASDQDVLAGHWQKVPPLEALGNLVVAVVAGHAVPAVDALLLPDAVLQILQTDLPHHLNQRCSLNLVYLK